jgi:cytoskeleton protein RodZ
MRDVFQAEFGARLSAARQARNLSVADVAAKLKLTPRQIEALEREDLEQLPSEVFVRGFVRNYGRLVGVEPENLIAPVDAQAEVSETITAPSAGLNVGSNSLRRWLLYPLIALALFVVLVAALYHWLRQGEDSLIAMHPEVVGPVEPALSGGAPDEVISAPSAEIVLPSAAPEPAPVPAAPVLPPSEPRVEPVAPQPAANPPALGESVRMNADANVKTGLRSMRFEPTQDAWIQVVDSKGNRFSKLVRAGSAETFSGEPPFRLVVGEAALVKLTYNGHSIDLTPFIGQKVARLTLE